MTRASSDATPVPERDPARFGNGLLLVDKPAGLSSHDVVGRVRRVMRTRRVGHAGTLDPVATGLLVCAVGTATRLLQFVQGEPKRYRTRITFGSATNTDDITGTVIASGSAPDWSKLPVALASLTGTLQQIPPAFSAKHVDGERAYAKARRGDTVSLPPVPVTVSAWDVTARGDDWLEVDICCGAGTYIRSLARDLGLALGTVAHCAALRRLQSGPLHVEGAAALSDLRPGEGAALVNPLEAMDGISVIAISPEVEADVRQGRAVVAEQPGERAALVDQSGRIVAIAERTGSSAGARWQPRVVLPTMEADA